VKETPLVSIVIPAFNELARTQRAIASIRAYTAEPYELVLVDNGSTDGTGDYFRRIPDAVVVSNAENLGHAGGTNRGTEHSHGDVLVWLNNDVVVTEGWLGNLLRCLTSGEDVGMVGPVTNYSYAPRQKVEVSYRTLEEMQVWARAFNRGPDRWEDVDFLVGFCLVVKRAVVDQVGLLDDSFPLGFFDDNDYADRVRRSGYRLRVAGNTFVYHEGSVTFRHSRFDTAQAFRDAERRYREKWRRPE